MGINLAMYQGECFGIYWLGCFVQYINKGEMETVDNIYLFIWAVIKVSGLLLPIGFAILTITLKLK